MPWGLQSSWVEKQAEGWEQAGGCSFSPASGSWESATALEAFRPAWTVNPQQALSQIVTAWQGLAFPLKRRRKEGPSDPGQRLLLPAHHGRPCPSGKAAPQLGSHPQFLHPRTWLAPQFWKQLTMNERSSLMFPAHLLVKQPKQPPVQPQAPYPSRYPTRLLFQLPLPCPSLCWISLPPPYSRATCSLCMAGEEAGLSHCCCQEGSSKTLSAHWTPAGQAPRGCLGLGPHSPAVWASWASPQPHMLWTWGPLPACDSRRKCLLLAFCTTSPSEAQEGGESGWGSLWFGFPNYKRQEWDRKPAT